MRPRFTYRCIRPGCTTTKHSDVALDLPAFCTKCRVKDTKEAIILQQSKIQMKEKKEKKEKNV